MKQVITIRLEGGVIFENKSVLGDSIRKLPDGRYDITVEKHRKKRSTQANRYYWGVIVPVVQNVLRERGNRFTLEQIHDMLRANFLQTFVPLDEGHQAVRYLSTTELTKEEFGAYIEDIRTWAYELFNEDIPLPDEQRELRFGV
jgi:hypothetical protein